MNYFLLAETEFFRRINEAGDCNMEKAYTAFATQVIELCNGGMDMNLTVIALAYIEIELQHHPVRNLSEERREIAAYVSKALSFVRKMQKFLATPQVPPLISANNAYIYSHRPEIVLRFRGMRRARSRSAHHQSCCGRREQDREDHLSGRFPFPQSLRHWRKGTTV